MRLDLPASTSFFQPGRWHQGRFAVAFCDPAMSLVVIDGGLVAEAQLDARGLLPLRAEPTDSVSSATRSPRSLTRSENAPPASTAELCSSLLQAGSWNRPRRGTDELVEGEGPGQARLIDDDQLSGLEAPSAMAWSIAATRERSLPRWGVRRRYGRGSMRSVLGARSALGSVATR